MEVREELVRPFCVDAKPPKLAGAAAKSIPVHCVVESINHVYQWSQKYSSALHRSTGHVELDRFVIIPNNTAFRDLTEAALVRLGYSKDTAAASKGLVVLKNWLPLDLDTIAEDPVLTVNDVLGELTTLATLRILVFRETKNRFSDLKDKLLKLLLVQSQTQLTASGCPLDEAIILQMMKVGQTCPDLPEDLYKKFEQWWIMQSSAIVPKIQPSVLPQSVRDIFYGRNGLSPRQSNRHDSPANCVVPKADPKAHSLQSATQNQFQGQKTRMRTSFDTELELPKLQAWFADNPHPSRQLIHHYVSELNDLESRKGRKPLDVNNVVYWFKNARAAQKRAEVRGTNSGGTADAMNSGNSDGNANGYCKSSSPSEHGGKSYSGPGSVSEADDDEDDEFDDHREDEVKPLMSPPAEQPMSLTTHGRFSNGERESPRPQSRGSQHSSEHKELMVIKEEPPDKEKMQSNVTTGLNNNEYDDDDDDDEDDYDEDMDDDASDGGGSCSRQERPPRSAASSTACSPDDRQPANAGHPHNAQQHATGPQPPPPPPLFHQTAAADIHQTLVRPGFPMVPNSMFSHSLMYMSQCFPGFNVQARRTQTDTSPPPPPPPHSQQPQVSPAAGLNLSALQAEERRKRNRTFIDPVSEVPRLEQWFEHNTHPSHSLIARYTDELNRMPYRQKFPRLESKNVQFWFKNRRAKCKRLKMSLYDAMSPKDQFAMPAAYLNHD